MLYRKHVIFGLFLMCTSVFYVKAAVSNENEQPQGLLDNPIPIETNAGDLKISIIAKTKNDITIKSCDWFSECSTITIPKVFEKNTVKVYRRGKHNIALINENDKWKAVGNVYILDQMEEIEKQPKAIFARGCGDWEIAVMEETEKDIKVEDCAWGMGWSCNTYKISKVSEQDGVKIYKEDEITFTNNNGKWGLSGHMCADRQIEIKTGHIFQANCMGFEMLITAEADNEITVKRDYRTIYNIPKVAEQDGVKVYSDGKLLYHKDREAFINNNGEWVLLGHLCSEVNSTEVLTHKCSNSDRMIKINNYDNYGLIVAEIQDSNVSCESKDDVLFMLKDKSVTDKDVFTNGDFHVEHTKNDWIIDEKLCDIIKDCSTNNWPEI